MIDLNNDEYKLYIRVRNMLNYINNEQKFQTCFNQLDQKQIILYKKNDNLKDTLLKINQNFMNIFPYTANDFIMKKLKINTKIKINTKKIILRPKIKTITDLIKLCKKYPLDSNISYNINMRVIHNINPPLIKLNNMIGLRALKQDVLKQISKKHNIQLNIITSNAQDQPNLSNIKVNKIEFDVDNFYNEIDKFDVGICPIYSKELELLNKDKIIRNGNRAVTLLCRGIPSVISPTPQVISDLKDNEHVLYAVSEEEWYEGLNNLLSNSNLYNSISEKGLELVKNKFSVENGYHIFEKIIFDYKYNQI